MNRSTYVAVVAVAAITMACQSTGPNTTTVNGFYNLVLLNGIAMPVVTATPAGPDSIISETLQLTESGVFAVMRIRSFPAAGGGRSKPTTHMTGTYTRDGSSITLQYDLGLGTSPASFDGTTIKTTFKDSAKVYSTF